jgi:hypothetical protein
MRLDRLELMTVGALFYLLLGSVSVFGILDTGALEGRQVAKWVVLALLGLVHLTVGVALGSWLVLTFPSGLVLLAARRLPGHTARRPAALVLAGASVPVSARPARARRFGQEGGRPVMGCWR